MEGIYKIAPHFLQNIMISIFNFQSYRKRYGGNYRKYRKLFKQAADFSLQELRSDQKKRFSHLINHAIQESSFYRELYKDVKGLTDIDNIAKLPIVSKETIRKNIDNIYTIPLNKGIVSKTGGTTGKSLKVVFTVDNMQERFAMLDNFRSKRGYKLGKRTAWFSGKNLLNHRDLKHHRFWKTDNWYKVRYYSTFHIKEDYLKFYIQNLKAYKPEYLVGFPSNLLEIAKYGLKNDIPFPEGVVKAVFPTAENVLSETRKILENYFHASVYDQYASSEGAPFIFECERKNLHLELQSGVFEILDDSDASTKEGRLIVTSFTSYGTPLIRYDIGDRIALSDEQCSCANKNPIIKSLLGREDDFVYSPQNGKINLGNVSNTLKGTHGILKFQVIQNSLNGIEISAIIDERLYNDGSKTIFLKNWKDRIGENMKIELNYVNDIPVEASGKFRLVKNHIKHLIQ